MVYHILKSWTRRFDIRWLSWDTAKGKSRVYEKMPHGSRRYKSPHWIPMFNGTSCRFSLLIFVINFLRVGRLWSVNALVFDLNALIHLCISVAPLALAKFSSICMRAWDLLITVQYLGSNLELLSNFSIITRC